MQFVDAHQALTNTVDNPAVWNWISLAELDRSRTQVILDQVIRFGIDSVSDGVVL